MALDKIIGIFGSRSLNDDRVNSIIADYIERNHPDAVATAGEPVGVCQAAREYCRDNAIPLLLFHIDTQRAGGMYHHRSLSLLNRVESMLFIHDGISKGTSNEIKQCEELGIPYSYFTLAPIETANQWANLSELTVPEFDFSGQANTPLLQETSQNRAL